ncbi:hypothetical protein MRB53_017450 [Persea americana]|uniref:Uncharacterized protein n=1 Tax=Persea americana TaxID=3435 RepID=A0ACC2M541_PERAE|nr:hypothetical protein MRB53_017450 [Persea americana]
MAFPGTTQKCQACDKTVYLVDQLDADNRIFHKACFRCHHCKGTLKLSNFNSFEGVLYCRPHYDQLFKRTGSLDKSFEGTPKVIKPERSTDNEHAANKASSMFAGTRDKCVGCKRTAYPLEKRGVFHEEEDDDDDDSEFAAICRRLLFRTTFERWWWKRSLSKDALVEHKPGEIGIVSGIPHEHLHRRVVIYSPARTATQQGSGKVGKWKENFMSTQKWENPLMGWTSTGDPYANIAWVGVSGERASCTSFKVYFRPVWTASNDSQLTSGLLFPKAYADNFKWKGPPKSEEA